MTLRRSPMRRGSGFARPERPARQAPVLRSVMTPVTRGVVALVDEVVRAVPKTEQQRNRRLLDLARGRPCLLLVPGCCNHRTDTTVACHSNLSIHGKAGARKADDHYSVWGCSACHRWLDQGGAPAAIATAAFMSAHLRQVVAWRQLEADPDLPLLDRQAIRWALARLNATPTGEQP